MLYIPQLRIERRWSFKLEFFRYTVLVSFDQTIHMYEDVLPVQKTP